jgi:hypothetical protein
MPGVLCRQVKAFYRRPSELAIQQVEERGRVDFGTRQDRIDRNESVDMDQR